MPIVRTLNHEFFKQWSPEMAYVLGYFAADGSMLDHKNGGKYIEFTSTDRILLENLKQVTNSDHAIAARPLRSANCAQSWRIQLGSKEWFNDLLKLGLTQNKSLSLRLPKVPRRYFGHFVRGYFDGDGCVYFGYLKYADRSYSRWILMTLFTCGSRVFLEELRQELRRYGISKGTIVRKTKGSFELKFSHHDSLALYQLMYHTGQISGLFLPRKREKLEKAIQILNLDKPHAAVA